MEQTASARVLELVGVAMGLTVGEVRIQTADPTQAPARLAVEILLAEHLEDGAGGLDRIEEVGWGAAVAAASLTWSLAQRRGMKDPLELVDALYLHAGGLDCPPARGVIEDVLGGGGEVSARLRLMTAREEGMVALSAVVAGLVCYTAAAVHLMGIVGPEEVTEVLADIAAALSECLS